MALLLSLTVCISSSLNVDLFPSIQIQSEMLLSHLVDVRLQLTHYKDQRWGLKGNLLNGLLGNQNCSAAWRRKRSRPLQTEWVHLFRSRVYITPHVVGLFCAWQTKPNHMFSPGTRLLSVLITAWERSHWAGILVTSVFVPLFISVYAVNVILYRYIYGLCCVKIHVLCT